MASVMPCFSIVTPSFNQGDFLEECIDSVLSQGYDNLEYIIMDGGSTDNSVEIIKKYEKYLTYWQSEPDQGQYWAINAGFARSRGEVMAWINSDDKYHSNAFFSTNYIFARHPEVEWLTGRPSWWGKNGELLEISSQLPTYCQNNFLNGQFDKPWVQQESTFWRRSLWNKAGAYLDTSLELAGDLELWVRFFRYSDLYILDALLGGYRSYGNQKAVLSKNQYLSEAANIIKNEAERILTAGELINTDAPPIVAIDPLEMQHFYRKELPPGGRVNFSSHQVYLYLLDQLSRAQKPVQEITKNNCHITNNKIIDMLKKIWDNWWN